METTSQQKEYIREIIRKLISDDKAWFQENFILVGDKGKYWILNYRQGPRNPHNVLVRGMIVQKPDAHWHGDELDLIRSFPFTRFFNHGEADAAHVNFSNSKMLEKLDGTMIGIFFPHGNDSPEFHTRKMTSLNDEDMKRKITSFHGKEYSFLPTIKQYVDRLTFDKSDVNYTYVCEFLHEVSYVVTKYTPEQHGLYLLGARNIRTHKELTEKELDAVSKRIGTRRPHAYDAVADLSQIEKMFQLAAVDTPDFEGYVFRDKETGNRVKVKDPAYVKKHHALDSTSFKALLPKILEGEEDEILAYLPHFKSRVDEIKEAYNKFLNKITDKVLEWKAKNLSPRELSLRLFGEENPLPKWELRLKKMRGEEVPKFTSPEDDKFTRNTILSYSSYPEKDIKGKVDEVLKRIALGQSNNIGDPKKLVQMIGLNDPEEEDSENQSEE